MNRNESSESVIETAIKNARFARDLQNQYGGAHVRKLPSGAFRRDGTPKGKNLLDNGDKGQRGQVVVLRDIAQGTPDRVSTKGNSNDRKYTVVEKYLYKKCNLSLLIPEDVEIVKVPAHTGENITHFRTQIGDILVHIYSNDPPKPGDYVEGLAEIKVSRSQRPNMGPKVKLYPYLNVFVEYGNIPEFFAEFNLVKRRIVPKGSIDFSPSPKGMIIHLNPVDVSPGISVTTKSR